MKARKSRLSGIPSEPFRSLPEAFQSRHKLSHSQVEVIRKTHRLARKDMEALRLVIASAIYPQYAVLDGANRYNVRLPFLISWGQN